MKMGKAIPPKRGDSTAIGNTAAAVYGSAMRAAFLLASLTFEPSTHRCTLHAQHIIRIEIIQSGELDPSSASHRRCHMPSMFVGVIFPTTPGGGPPLLTQDRLPAAPRSPIASEKTTRCHWPPSWGVGPIQRPRNPQPPALPENPGQPMFLLDRLRTLPFCSAMMGTRREPSV